MKSLISVTDIYKLTWPAIISLATVLVIGIINLAFVAQLPNSTILIVAASIANNVSNSLYSFLEGLRTGTTILTAEFYGAKQNENISKTLNASLYYALVLGGILFLLAPFITIFVFYFFEKEVAIAGSSYLIVQLTGLPCLLIVFAVIGFFRGLNNTFIPMIITLITCLFDILLSYIFMYGKWGFPALGMIGVAVATASSYILAMVICFPLLYFLPLTKKYINFITPFSSIKKHFVKTSSDLGLYTGIVVITFFLFIVLFIPQGSKVVAAHQIVFQIFATIYLFPIGFFVATSIIIGNLMGEKDHSTIIPTTFKIWLTSLPVIGGISLLIALLATPIATFFSPHDPEVAHITAHAIYLICITNVLCSIFEILKGALAAVKETRYILITGLITSFFFFLPLAYILGIWLNYGVWGGYLAFVFWAILDNLLLAIRFFSKPWLTQP